MKIYQLLFLAMLFIFTNCSLTFSQSFYLYGDKTFGGNSVEFDGNIISLPNGDLIIGGQSFSDINGDKNVPLCSSNNIQNDIWLLKIDTAFNIIWQKDIGGNDNELRSNIMAANISNNILFAAASRADSSCDKSENNRSFPLNQEDYWIGMLDNNGTTIFEKTFGGIQIEGGTKIVELSTGEFIIGGVSSGGIGADKSVSNFGYWDCWLIKTDSIGNKIWDNVYGGILNELGLNYEFNILPLDGGSFLLGTTTDSPVSGNISDTSRGSLDYWIIKIDNNGNKIWDKRYGGTNQDALYHIEPTTDNGFILCGSTNSPQGGDVSQAEYGQSDYWVVKIDSMGNKMWDKRYGGASWDYGYWIEQDFDEGYWVGGYTKSDSISFDISEPSYGGDDYWLIKIDSLGNKLFDKRFGGPGDDILRSFIILPDSSVMLFGEGDSGTSSIKTDVGKGISDYWLIHFYYGNNPPVSVNEIKNTELISVYPNPATDFLSFSATNNFSVKKILLYDVTGRLIIDESVNNDSRINISSFSSAIYFYEIQNTKGERVFGKFLKQ